MIRAGDLIRAMLFAAACLVAGRPGSADSQQADKPQADGPWIHAIQAARTSMEQRMRTGAVPGAAVAVAVNGRLVWSEAFGDATRATRFGLGSISKTLTMAAALRLADRGRLDLDAPIERYLPDWPHRGKAITVRRLAAHQSGLSDEFANRHYTSTAHFPDLDSAYRHIRAERLMHEPGARTHYATGLYTIVGRVLEVVSGMAYPALMRREVFEPASMGHTAPHDPRRPPPTRTRFFVLADGRLEERQAIDPSHKLPGAGFLATADDLARFGSAVLDSGFLSPEAREQMFRAVPLADGSPTPYALGFQARSEGGRRVLLQPGGGIGIAGWLAVYPDDGVVVALLSNLTAAPLDPATIAEAFLSCRPSRTGSARCPPARDTSPRTP